MSNRRTKKTAHTCGACARAFGHCSPSLDGKKLLMCKCPHAKGGKHYILTSRPACPMFRKK